ncbi:MAG: energy-dependent translational throttle protein EttA [Rhodobacterales bacterium]|nr:MAG: energy-dependent translational throttle protein EttA [Rhodobacterales bacterium]
MSSVKYIYHMQDLTKSFPGGKKCFENIHLSFLPGVKIGVVGVNGAGKSSLMKIMAGLDKDYIGEAWAAENVNVGYLPQEPILDSNLTVRENVLTAVADKKALIDEFNNVAEKLANNYSEEIMEQMTELQDKIDAQNLWELDNQINIAMDALRCPSDESNIKELSGGEKRRVALCQLLLNSPELLLLDEPTNHLDAETVDWLQRFLIDYKGTCLIVTHDRYFLDKITGWILELDRGKGLPYEGNYSSWLEQKTQRLELEGKEDKKKQKVLEKELEWIRQGAKARQAKQKARIKSYEELVNSSERVKQNNAQIIIPNGERLGSKVIEVKNLGMHFEDKILFDNLSFSLPPGGIVGIIGPNGAGKSTLFKLIIGVEKPSNGEILLGETVKLSYVDQSRDDLNNSNTVWEEISGGQEIVKLGELEVNSRAYCSSFNFKGSDQQKPMSKLSGGERNRVHIAKMLKSGGNVLMLDEPTNDLDVETLSALEYAISEFAGSAMVISHDRFFLNRICTHILAFEGDSHVEWFEGDYDDYIKDKKRRLGEDAVNPKRTKYRKFVV